MNKIQTAVEFGLELAAAASEAIMPRFRNCAVDIKSDGSEVTDADRAAEDVMSRMISQRFPEDGIFGEEFGQSGSQHASRVWVLDPIDGTASFTLGIPLFGTLVALCVDNDPMVGVIHFPALNETVYAGKELGCWFKSSSAPAHRVHVASNVRLNEAVVSASGVHGTNILSDSEPSKDLVNVVKSARKFRFVGDCMQHALVARGKTHAAIDTVMKPWDIAALVPCVEEAGGVVTDATGKRDGILFAGSLISGCSKAFHQELLDTLTMRSAGYPTVAKDISCSA
jgi:histidinol-phosphatase